MAELGGNVSKIMYKTCTFFLIKTVNIALNVSIN